MRRVVAGFVVVVMLPGLLTAGAVVDSASGLTAADILAARDQFRVDLGGGVVAGANGSFGGLRREINWDGVGDALSAPNNLPANFFNANSPRGAVFSTAGTGFQVSATAAVGNVRFANIDPSYSSTFQVFSAQRLFTALGSNILDVTFFLPGTATAATVSGFGSVFSDVDLPNTTSMAYFDSADNLLGSFFVPAQAGTQTFSFLGVSFNAGERVARVRITNGNAALGANVLDGTTDVVVMDDFLYSEPSTVPEPGTLVLLSLGLISGGAFTRRRRI